MNKQNRRELATKLEEWFNNIVIKDNFWNKDEVAKLIKKRLTKLGYFKNQPSGSIEGRKLAKTKMEYRMKQKDGFDGTFEEFKVLYQNRNW